MSANRVKLPGKKKKKKRSWMIMKLFPNMLGRGLIHFQLIVDDFGCI